MKHLQLIMLAVSLCLMLTLLVDCGGGDTPVETTPDTTPQTEASTEDTTDAVVDTQADTTIETQVETTLDTVAETVAETVAVAVDGKCGNDAKRALGESRPRCVLARLGYSVSSRR